MPEKIINVDYESEIGQSYVDYAMSVITDRALPDVRDGLKPVQRRVLYALNSLSKADSPYRKCARIVGDTMGKYHPHGDSSIYECLVNMAQNWKLNNPLVNPQGNFGAVDGSSAASMRYTEARIDKYTENVCMKDLRFFKDTFIPNFDNTESEPEFLPFQVPNILINGTSGIAVGMDSEIPTHNLGEVISALIAYLDNPKITLDEIMDIMIAPDFATGGIINTTRENLRSIYETGLGKLRVRGKIEIKDIGYGKRSICVTELPVTMIGGTKKFLEKVAELARDGYLPAVIDIADRGDKNGECLCIDLKRCSDEELENTINTLYKKAKLEDTQGIRMRVIDKGIPKIMGLMEILKTYTEFKYYLYNTKYEKLHNEQLDIKEIKEGLVRAVDIIDLIIEILRGSKNVSQAKECLMYGKTEGIKFRFKGSETDAKNLDFTEKQADAILSMRLQKLIGLELEALKKELDEAIKLEKKYKKLLSSKSAMTAQMIEDLEEIRKEFNQPRKTKVANYGEVILKKAEESISDVAILFDRFSYIKVIDKAIYDKNLENIEKDYKIHFASTTAERVGIFTDDNSYHILKVADLIKIQSKKNLVKNNSKNTKGKKVNASGTLLGKLTDKGIQLSTIIDIKENTNILHINTVENIANGSMLFVSKDGKAKRTKGSEYDISKKCSKPHSDAFNMAYIGIVEDKQDIVAQTKDGYFTRVSASEIAEKGKNAGLGKFMELSKTDEVVNVSVGTTKDVFLANGKEIPYIKIKPQNKGNKGVKMRI